METKKSQCATNMETKKSNCKKREQDCSRLKICLYIATYIGTYLGRKSSESQPGSSWALFFFKFQRMGLCADMYALSYQISLPLHMYTLGDILLIIDLQLLNFVQRWRRLPQIFYLAIFTRQFFILLNHLHSFF